MMLGMISNTELMFGQSAAVSSYFNASDPREEWSELLVVSDNLSLYNSTFRDNNATQTGWQSAITFSNAAYWSSLRAGTVILVWHRRKDITGTNDHPQDINKDDGYIEIWANDPIYFTGGDFGSAPAFNGPSLNIAGGGDLLQLRDGGSANIHALGHIPTPGSTFGPILGPKLNHTQTLASFEALFVCPGGDINQYGTTPPQSGTTWTAKAANPNITRGLPNQCTASSTANSDFWRSLRQPAWNSPTLTATYNAPNIDLSWNAATDPNPADGTQGYMIVRSTVNNFILPNDGYTYALGENIGSGTVAALIPSSQTLSYSDPYTINCGDTVYYRIYAYRFGTDNMNGNNYNPARGRAYNETSFGQASIGIPDAPVITDVSHTDAYCGMDDGTITVTATYVTGVTVEYSIDGTNWQTDFFFDNLPPGSYTVYVRIVGFNQCQVTFSPVVIDDFASPTLLAVDHEDASCGLNSGIITITATGGTAPLEYSIDDGVTWWPNNVFNNLAPNSYWVKIKDANDCEVSYLSNPVVIDMIPSPVPPDDVSVDRNNLCSDDAGTITLTATGGSGLTLEWFTGSCGGTPVGSGSPLTIDSPAATTTYYAYWTSAICGNSACESVTVTVTDPPTPAEAGIQQSLCGVLSTNLDANTPVVGTGLWTQVNGAGPSVFADPSSPTTLVTVTVYGSYTYRWTISSGPDCPDSQDDVVVSYGDAILVSAGSNSPVCTGNDIFLTSSIAGATYLWSGPNGFTSTEQNPVINNATLADEGTYTVFVSGIPNFCPDTQDDTEVDIVEAPVAPLTVTADPDTVCAGLGGTITLTATGGSGTLLFWYEGVCQGPVAGTGNNISIPAPDVTTTYYAAWSSDLCGLSQCTPVTVFVAEPPSIAEAGDPQSLCGVLTTTMAAVPPAIGTGLWTTVSGPGTVTIADPADENTVVDVTAQGIYVLRWTVTNGTACPASEDDVSVNFGDAIQVVAASNSPVCTGNVLILSSSIAGATYLWTGPNGFTSTEQNPVITGVTMAAAGSYQVSVTDIPGECPDTQNTTDVTVNLSATAPVQVTASLGTICADYTGNLELTATGGSGETLEWFTGSCGGTMIGTGATLTLDAPDITTTYFARWTSTQCGNSACLDVTVTVEQPPTAANAGTPQSICNQLTTNLEANTPVTGNGQWTTLSGPGTILYADDTSPTTFITASNIGVYTLRWTISSGGICQPSSSDVTIEFGNILNVSASSNSPVCEGEDLELYSSIAGATYDWTGPGGFSSNVQNPVIPAATAANSGDYIVTVSDIPGGCPLTSNSTTVEVGAIPSAPVVSADNLNGSNQEVCAGALMTYSVVGPVPGSAYVWGVTGGGTIQSTGSDDIIDIAWFATGGSYDITVTETTAAGCTGDPAVITATVMPTSTPAVTILADNNPVCPGEPIRFTAIAANAGNDPVYRWIHNGLSVGTNDSVLILDLPVTNDQLACEITSSSFCSDPAAVTSDTLLVSVFAPAIVDIATQDPVCAGSPNLLDAGASFAAYLWSDGSTGPAMTASDEGIYWVLVTDANGCSGSDTVAVEPCETIPEVYAPNAFTPDGNGTNDRFFLVSSNPEQVNDFEMIIYNRWGQRIFITEDMAAGWDGTMNGNPCPADVYSYVIFYSYSAGGGGTQKMAGTVTLLR